MHKDKEKRTSAKKKKRKKKEEVIKRPLRAFTADSL
jgi:hypothetical protein